MLYGRVENFHPVKLSQFSSKPVRIRKQAPGQVDLAGTVERGQAVALGALRETHKTLLTLLLGVAERTS